MTYSNIFDKEVFYNGSVQGNFFGNQMYSQISISPNNLNQIKTIQSLGLLEKGWDSYGAEKPSYEAITKAISFALWLSERDVEIFFVAPTLDGDILMEIKNFDAAVEFIFSNNQPDKVLGWWNNEVMQSAQLNDTTRNSYLKWLICPHGGCPDFE